MTARFITSSGTEIGKTFVTASLAAQLSANGRNIHALKPVMSGYTSSTASESDAGILLNALNREVTAEAINHISPWRFEAALSPDMAAAREGQRIDFEELLTFCRTEMNSAYDDVLIEGVGGVMVPLNEDRTVLDWMKALGIPTLLVVGSYLGSMSHTLTAYETLRSAGLKVETIIVSETPGSEVPLTETIETLSRFIKSTRLIALEHRTSDQGFTQDAGRLLDQLP